MTIIDLSQEIYDGMPVYPGDPEIKITLAATFDDGGWNMRRLEMNSHDGTHVNVQSTPLRMEKRLMTI